MVDPRFDGLLGEPDGEAAAVDEGFVIVAPVTEVVRAIAALVFHALRLSALQPP